MNHAIFRPLLLNAQPVVARPLQAVVAGSQTG
jgi:hypothetical protein